jgi:hypothetical protein
MLHFLHVPKTGGSARRYALRKAYSDHRVIFSESHADRLSAVDERDTPVVYLRHPLDRFISAYDSLVNNPFIDAYPTAEAAAMDIEHAYALAEHFRIFMRQTWWFDVPRDDAIRKRTEDMDRDFRAWLRPYGLRPDLPAPGNAHRNTGRRADKPSPLTYHAVSRVLDFYADDLMLWEETP